MASKIPVLVVDDNEVNQVAVAEELELGGYSVELASNGQEAVDLVKANSYRLVLMDCEMPVKDGYVATMEIRNWEEEVDRRTPIIALTGHTAESEKARAISSGMDDLIAKPFTAEDLKRIMAAYPAPDGRKSSGPETEPDLTPGVRRSRRLLDLFLKLVPIQLTDLRDRLEVGDAERVRAMAHKLKGSCLAISAHPMAKAAEKVQYLAEDGDLTRAASFVLELEQRLAVVEQLIKEERELL